MNRRRLAGGLVKVALVGVLFQLGGCGLNPAFGVLRAFIPGSGG